MSHDDFQSLEVTDVLLKFLGQCLDQTGSASAHWISAHAYQKLDMRKTDDWQWLTADPELHRGHLSSLPATDLFKSYQMWHGSLGIFPNVNCLSPQFLRGMDSTFIVPVSFDGHWLGLLALKSPAKSSPVEVMAQLNPALAVGSKYIFFAYQYLEAKEQSYVDDLTGLYNQRYLALALDHEIHRSRRENSTFSLLFLDIDYFKAVNDGRGHWVGSQLLADLAKVLRAQVRACDYTFRYGGDEFIVVLPNTSLENSKIVAERVRSAIETHTFKADGHDLHLTVSIGLAAFPDHGQSVASLIKLADEAMYFGKRKSRNIVFVAS